MKPSYRVTLINGQVLTTDDPIVTNLRFTSSPSVRITAIIAGNTRTVLLFSQAVAMIEEM